MKEIKNLRQIAHELFFILNETERKRFIFSVILIVIGSFFELLGVSAVIPFIQAITAPESLANSPIIQPLLNYIHISSFDNIVVVMTIVLVIIYVIKNIYLMLANVYQIWFRCQFQKDLSQRMLEAYLKRPYLFFINTNSSKLIRGINTDVTGVYDVLQHGSRILAEFFTCVVIGTYIFCVDAVMATGTLVVAFSTMLIIAKTSKGKLKKMSAELRDVIAEKGKFAYQAIMGNKEIKVMNRTQSFLEAYEREAEKAKTISISYNILLTMPERIIEIICISGIFLLACISFYFNGSVLFVEKLAAFSVAAFRILPSISRVSSDINAVIFNIAPMRATYTNIKEVEEYEIYDRNEYPVKSKDVNVDLEYRFQNKIVLNSVTWKYPKAADYVLYRTGFSIQKGESIGIIGTSGAGKSTLTDIILGLLHPQEGSVEMDGIDVFTIPIQWSKNVGYVPQTVFLTDDTIAGNIAFGLSESEIDEKQVWKTLEQSRLAEYVKSLPKGIHTIVGERGVKLSGGQRHRIAIARALYYNPDIFVLDEATAALDNETEAELMQSIESLQGSKTMIIVAHRLSSIKKCDRIFEVINGSIIERTKEEVFGKKM